MSAADLAEFEQLSRRRPKRCVVAKAFDALTDEQDRANLTAALDAPHIANNSIAKWLRARKLGGSDQAVKLHRDRDCCCVS